MATKKTTKKSPVKKATSKKSAVKKAAAKKTSSKGSSKKSPSKKAAPKKSTVKKAAPKKTTAKPGKKTAAAKKVVKKASAKKVTKKFPSKKAAPKKKLVKKAAPKKGKKAAKKAAARVKKSSKKVVTTTTTVVTTTTTSLPEATETHYLLILDESGSMSSTRQQTLDGLNEQIQAINKLEAKYPDHKYFINILKFDNDFEYLVTDTPVSKVKEFTFEDYNPNGSTALRDAIGKSVTTLEARIQSKVSSGEAKALVIILTDGEENASREYSAENIKSLITRLDATQMWTFTFIGANQDSVTTANSYGIHASNVANYSASMKGTKTAFAAVSAGLSNRASGYSSHLSGGELNRAFMSSVLQDSVNIGESADVLNVVDDLSNAKINTATGTGTGTATTNAADNTTTASNNNNSTK